MSNDLAKLNRLRVNAGKTELKSWKASQMKLNDQIAALEKEGFVDVLPGANTEAAPVIADPTIAAARPDPEPVEEAPAKEMTGKVKPQLARGLETDGYARHSRKSVQDHRQHEREAEKEKRKAEKKETKVELSDEDKKQIKDEADSRKPKKAKGAVDPKKDPEKAARQQKHIEEKRKASGRDKAPAKEKDANVVTAADIARSVDMDPKVARAKLRRHAEKIKKIYPAWGGIGDWNFPKKHSEAIGKILKGDK